MRFLPPLRKGENLRKEARKNLVAWVATVLFYIVWNRHQQWDSSFCIIYALLLALLTFIDVDEYYSWRSGQGPSYKITPDRDETPSV
jgi:hypothetical protein